MRPGGLSWRATAAERRSQLPGDELLRDANGVCTRAITIGAPRWAVWPWLAQMGPSPRGGAYTYDWIENLLGLNMHSADRVLPDFQHPRVGDAISLGSNRMRLERVDHERVLAWRSHDGHWVWTFVLDGRGGSTRLISRNRFRAPALKDRIALVAMGPASLVMERKMLRGIKRRAEGLMSGPPVVIRPADPGDLAGIELLLDGLSADARYRRWFSAAVDLSAAARWAVHPPGGFGLVAVVSDEIVGHGALVPSSPGHAEVAFEVAAPWRRHGIATHLLQALERQARERGIDTLEADVLYFNAAMLTVFSEQRDCTKSSDGTVVHVTFPARALTTST